MSNPGDVQKRHESNNDTAELLIDVSIPKSVQTDANNKQKSRRKRKHRKNWTRSISLYNFVRYTKSLLHSIFTFPARIFYSLEDSDDEDEESGVPDNSNNNETEMEELGKSKGQFTIDDNDNFGFGVNKTESGLLKVISSSYDSVVWFLFDTLGMETDPYGGVRNITVPNRRIRSWFLIFGLFLIILGFIIACIPEPMLKAFGWETVEPIATRLLGFFMISNGWLNLCFSNSGATSLHSSVSTNSVMICLGIAISLVIVMVEYPQEGSVTKTIVSMAVMIVMGFFWMYCKGFSLNLNQEEEDEY